jgi:hypothetical protein
MPQATGSFQLSSLGLKLGDRRSLTTLSTLRQLQFYVWGRYDGPQTGEVTITNNQAEFGTYPFDIISF